MHDLSRFAGVCRYLSAKTDNYNECVLRNKYVYLHVQLSAMDKKLTLSLNQKVIEKAKKYARLHRTSLSRMIEAYFDTLTGSSEEDPANPTTPLVESLCGIIQLPEEFNYKEARAKHLNEKYK